MNEYSVLCQLHSLVDIVSYQRRVICALCDACAWAGNVQVVKNSHDMLSAEHCHLWLLDDQGYMTSYGNRSAFAVCVRGCIFCVY